MDLLRNYICLLKKRLLLILFILLAFGVYKLHIYRTDGFSLQEITPQFKYRDDWTPPMQTLSQEQLKEILKQPFSYLGKGAQVYAFVSTDQKYVLKLVKQKHLHFNSFETAVYKLSFMETFKNKRLTKQKNRVQRLLYSSSLAFQYLKEETGLLYIHLLPTDHLNSFASITDKAGESYLIDLDAFEFIIQLKGDSLIHTLSTMSLEEKKEALKDLLVLLVNRSKKGIKEMDRRLLENIGFLDGNPFFIDAGRFVLDKDVSNQKIYRPLLNEELRPLKLWLKQTDPQTAIWFKEQVAQI